MDNLTIKERSFAMSQVKNKDNKLELRFRRYIWLKGVKGYKTKQKMQGNPDLYFPKKKVAVFLDGCFWHGCKLCNEQPIANSEYWKSKFEKNSLRDKKTNEYLRSIGVRVVRFWGHELKEDMESCSNKLYQILSN